METHNTKPSLRFKIFLVTVVVLFCVRNSSSDDVGEEEEMDNAAGRVGNPFPYILQNHGYLSFHF